MTNVLSLVGSAGGADDGAAALIRCKLAAADGAVTALAEANVLMLSTVELAGTLARLQRLINALGAVQTGIARRIEQDGLAGEVGARSTADLLSQACNLSAIDAGRMAGAARDLPGLDLMAEQPGAGVELPQLNESSNTSDPVSGIHPGSSFGRLPGRYPALAAALERGVIGPAAVAVARKYLNQVPDWVSADVTAVAEQMLTAYGRVYDPVRLARVARRIVDRIDPDGRPPDWLESQEALADERRMLQFGHDANGMWTMKAVLPADHGAQLQAAILALAGVRRGKVAAAEPNSDEPGNNEQPNREPGGMEPGSVRSGGSQAEGWAPDGAAKAGCGVPDQRSHAQRCADALLELADIALRSEDVPTNHGSPVRLGVMIDWDGLRDATGAGQLETGEELSPSRARMLACDAGVLPTVMAGQSLPLDVGRERRSASFAQRMALCARDGGCAFPGCDRPPSRCDAHHIVHWLDGGPTDLSNLVLLCGFHHHRCIHADGWSVEISHRGAAVFRPPVWLDRTQSPMVNQTHLSVRRT